MVFHLHHRTSGTSTPPLNNTTSLSHLRTLISSINTSSGSSTNRTSSREASRGRRCRLRERSQEAITGPSIPLSSRAGWRGRGLSHRIIRITTPVGRTTGTTTEPISNNNNIDSLPPIPHTLSTSSLPPLARASPPPSPRLPLPHPLALRPNLPTSPSRPTLSRPLLHPPRSRPATRPLLSLSPLPPISLLSHRQLRAPSTPSTPSTLSSSNNTISSSSSNGPPRPVLSYRSKFPSPLSLASPPFRRSEDTPLVMGMTRRAVVPGS
jgi:hypothetical protein